MDCLPHRLTDIPAAPGAVAQRAIGVLSLGFATAGPGTSTRISKFYQQGCLKARLPRPIYPSICEAVSMNISGGIAGGDVLTTTIELGENAQLCLASAAAERVYRARAGVPAIVSTAITLRAGASLAYLPQETILFDGFSLSRKLTIDLAENASFLGVESLIFGRQAMGEFLSAGHLRDTIILRREGHLRLQDMTRLNGDIATQLRRPAIAGANIATANIIYAALNAAALLDPVRTALAGQKHAGATLVDGILRVRILAPSSNALRRLVAAVIKLCRDGRAMPPVWQI